MIVAPSLPSPDQALKLARRVFSTVCGRVDCDGVEIDISVSMGVALSDASCETAPALMQRADTAMYAAKRGGRGRVELFSRSMTDSVGERLVLQGELIDAIGSDQLALHYQPIVALDRLGQEPDGYETLARWNHPTRGAACRRYIH